MVTRWVALFVLVLLGIPVAADDKPAAADKRSDPAGVPVQIRLLSAKKTYPLDLKGKSAEEFQKQIAEGVKQGKLPAVPEVELIVEITNTGAKEIEIWTKGDPVQIDLELKGPGAVTIDPMRAFTQEFRIPETVKLAPGKSTTLSIWRLMFGFRGESMLAYWTKPGDYTIKATLHTGISPKPAGSEDNGEGFGLVKLYSKPITVAVK